MLHGHRLELLWSSLYLSSCKALNHFFKDKHESRTSKVCEQKYFFFKTDFLRLFYFVNTLTGYCRVIRDLI